MHKVFFKESFRYFSKITIDKPPRSAYYKFFRDSYPKFKSDFQKLGETAVKISHEFKHLSPEQLKDIEKSFQKVKEDYESLSKLKGKENVRRLIEVAQKYGLPSKCPKSGFNIFMSEEILNITKQKANVDNINVIFRKAVEKWKALPVEEIETYHKKFLEAKKNFESDMKHWATMNGLPLFKKRSTLAVYFCYKEGLAGSPDL